MHDIVGEHGSGKQLTFYSLAGRGGRSMPIGGTRIGPRVRSATWPARNRSRTLVTETKVWSFWPLRTEWLREVDEWYPAGDLTTTGQLLVRRLVEGRAVHPTLAAAQDGMPPLCTVQDLMILSRHVLPAYRAAQLLIRAVGAQSEGSGNGEHIALDPGALTEGARSRQVLPDMVAVTSADTRINAAIEFLSTSGSAATGPRWTC